MSVSSKLFNLTLNIPSINKTMSNQSLYISMKLPLVDDLYIVDIHPMYNRQKVHFITTYLCQQPFSSHADFWFDSQPCDNMDMSMTIYEWYYNIPAVHWPKENRAEFSCQHRPLPMQMFSTELFSKYEGKSISLYRVRNREVQPIIKGNLQWPKTFYQVTNPVDIIANDYLIGTCLYEPMPSAHSPNPLSEVVCQINAMFWTEHDDETPMKICWNNDYSRILNRYLPVDEQIVPETLFDINPTYPKVTPNQYAIGSVNESILSWTSMNNKTNTIFLTYSQDDRFEKVIRLARNRNSLFTIIFIILLALCGIIMLLIGISIIRSYRNSTYSLRRNTRLKAISVGGETSSLSKWLTKRRFQEYDQDTCENGEKEPLAYNQNESASSDETDVSDNEVFTTTDFQNVILKY
ncbi:unnamed protein product [Rotaria socialis]|uniref:Copper type II ascorbate-dependent monooxygenase C-terminal domain-containing protein n=2 Tax=Rotaria socialis TaxID=392032 RepID=A0A820Z0G3_9BILA|nr:unnamed protein product [Rotaria socialis]